MLTILAALTAAVVIVAVMFVLAAVAVASDRETRTLAARAEHAVDLALYAAYDAGHRAPRETDAPTRARAATRTHAA